MALAKDFPLLVAACVALALAVLALKLSEAIAAPFNVHIPGLGHPFAGVATTLNNSIVKWSRDAVHGSEAAIAWLWNDLLSSLQLAVGLTALFGALVYKALAFMWDHSIPGFVTHEITNVVARLAPSRVDPVALAAKIETDVKAALRGEIATVRADAHAAASVAASAATAAAIAVEKATHAVTTEITRVVHDPATYVTNTVHEVVPGLAEALTHAAGEVAELPGLAIPDLRGMLDDLDLGTLAGLMAAIPIIRAITSTLAVESGLENAECRGKIKQVCGTNPSAWASLIGGLAAAGIAFNLRELVKVAEPVIADLAPVIREVAG